MAPELRDQIFHSILCSFSPHSVSNSQANWDTFGVLLLLPSFHCHQPDPGHHCPLPQLFLYSCNLSLCHFCCIVCSCIAASESLQIYVREFISTWISSHPSKGQSCFCPRIIIPVCLSAWKLLPKDLCLSVFFMLSWILPQCHLFKEAFPNQPSEDRGRGFIHVVHCYIP